MQGNWGLIRPGLGGGGPHKTQPLSVGFKMAQVVRHSSSGSCQRAMFAESQGHHVMARANPLVQPPTQRTPSRENALLAFSEPTPGSDVFLVAPCGHCLWRTLGKQAIPFLLWPLESSGVTPVAFVWPVAILSRPVGLHRPPHPLTVPSLTEMESRSPHLAMTPPASRFWSMPEICFAFPDITVSQALVPLFHKELELQVICIQVRTGTQV